VWPWWLTGISQPRPIRQFSVSQNFRLPVFPPPFCHLPRKVRNRSQLPPRYLFASRTTTRTALLSLHSSTGFHPTPIDTNRSSIWLVCTTNYWVGGGSDSASEGQYGGPLGLTVLCPQPHIPWQRLQTRATRATAATETGLSTRRNGQDGQRAS
jgi:hypothetical protein